MMTLKIGWWVCATFFLVLVIATLWFLIASFLGDFNALFLSFFTALFAIPFWGAMVSLEDEMKKFK